MKKISKSMLLAMLIVFSVITYAQTTGTLNFKVTTSTNNGDRKPNNVSAIWITNSAGVYQKTLEKNAGQRVNYLYKWLTANPSMNTTDAATGATLSNYKTYNVNWNCKDENQNVVPDGDYKIWIEFTDGEQQGPFTSFTFTKNTTPFTITPANISKFSNITITYTPDPSSITEVSNSSVSVKISPIPFNSFVNFSIDNPEKEVQIVIYDINGKKVAFINKNGLFSSPLVVKWDGLSDNGNQIKQGIYLYTIKNGNHSISGKIIKSN